MGYLGQKYDKGLVIQRSPEGSAFQEEVNVVADGDTEVTPKVGGGLKKVNISGGGGTEVIPNPELEGDEEFLSSVGIGDTNYKLSENDYTNNDKKAVKTIGNYVVEEYSDPQGNYNLCSFEAESIVNYVYTRLNFAGVDPNEFDQNIWSEGLLDLKNLNKLNKYKFNFTLTPTINNIRDEEHTMHVSLSLDDFDLDISDANACDATVGELRTINNFFENISASVTIGCVLHIETDSETGDSRAVISNFYAMIEESILSYDSDLVIDHIAVVYPENGVWFGQNNYPTTDGDYVLNVDGEIPSYKKFAVNPTLEGGESNLSGLQIGDTKYTVPQGTNVVANPTLAGTEANLTGLQVGDTKYKVPQGGGASVSGINIDVFHASNDDAVTMTRLTNTPQALNFIMDSSDLYDYFNSLYNHIKEDCQQGYVYDSSSGSIAEADLSKGMYQGISGQYNGETIYGLVACQSENEYGESRRELGAVNSGLIIDSSFAIVEDGQVEQTISLIEQKSIGME